MAISRRVGRSTRQVRRLLADPRSKSELRALFREQGREVSAVLASRAAKAARTLSRLACDSQQPVVMRVAACKVLLEQSRLAREVWVRDHPALPASDEILDQFNPVW